MAGPWEQFQPESSPERVEAGPWTQFQEAAAPVKKEEEFSGSWSDVPAAAVKNAPSSAVEFGKNIVQPFIHPIETAQNLGEIGGGVLQHLGLMKGEEHKPHATAVGKFLMDRYGSTEGIKKTLATDPVGLAADLSMVLTGGGGLAARAPGLVGKAGQIAGTVGRVVDPLTVPIKAATEVGSAVGRMAGSGLAGVVGGLGTHTGREPLIQAAKAGYEGGEGAAAFRENIRGIAPTEDAVADAQRIVDGMRKERGADYRASMAKLGVNTEILDFDKIDAALADSTKVQTYKGQVLNDKTQGIRREIGQAVQEWKMLPAAEYHTPEGLDALKRKIGDIRADTQYGTPARKVADDAYRSIGDTIKAEAPEYAQIMKGYEAASKQIKVIEKELSVPNRDSKGNIDTALRKMQSALRNNVNANFGRRKELLDFVARNGAPHLMAKLAGQALQPALPRGLGKMALTGLEGAIALGAGHATGALLPALGTAALMSPRLMGEAAYWGGAGARQLGRLPKAGLPAFQLGRTSEYQQGGRTEAYATDSPEFREEVRQALLRNPDSPTRKQAMVNRRNYLPHSPESVNIEDRRQRGGAVKITSRSGTHSIPVEIASTAKQQAKGLSGRRMLGKGRGMLFTLSSNRPTSFWMNNTHIPLDMIFIRADGRIAKIAENRKPLSRERVLSGGPVSKVLEVAGGTARKLGLSLGDKVS